MSMKIGLHKMMFFRALENPSKPAESADAAESAIEPNFNLPGALAVCIALVKSLQQVQNAIGQHKALCMANIAILDDGAIELRHDAAAPFGYMSPEQTGRMNRGVDYRSDFYSLGVIFYELMTGQLPFESDSLMALVHSHIARQPIALAQRNPEIGEMVSLLVMKLLSKNAEDRYQSIDGLLWDLQRCQSGYAASASIPYFELGENDLCDRLQIPQKLVGREFEVKQLFDAFQRVAQGGAELLLVKGYAGIGKSALVNEIQRPLTEQHGYFIAGKFDQFKRDIPYSAVNHALRELMRQILTESESQIAQWKKLLLAVLGSNASLIADVIPELAHIIGKQPKLLPSDPARNQYSYVMQKFVCAFARREHPLVIFLDDLQWADAASLSLIKTLMGSVEQTCLFLIGAYRDNEIDAADPLMLALSEIEKDALVTTIELKALPKASIAELIAATVRSSLPSAMPLADLIYRKTLGNPFFVRQFIQSIYNEQLLRFHDGGWHWDIKRIEAYGITDNVIDLLTKEISRLAAPTQHLLTLSACIGNEFDLATLAIVARKSDDDTLLELRAALQSGLIRHSRNADAGSSANYAFMHDRVQQAAYEGIPQGQKAAVHLQIGQLLLANLAPDEKEERIFDIVHQLNAGSALLTDQAQQLELAHLNLAAAKKARISAAFEVHHKFTELARVHGAQKSWPQEPDFMFALHMELIMSAFARAAYDEMEILCQVVCEKSSRPEQKIAAKEMLVRSYGAQYKPAELLKTGIELMTLAGIRVPPDLGRRHIIVAKIRLQAALRGRDPLTLAQLPAATDPIYLQQVQASAIFLGYGLTYLAKSKVVLWAALEVIRASVRYGISPACAYAYMVWGRTLAGELGRPVEGYKFGLVSSQLAQTGKSYLGAVGIFNGLMRHHHPNHTRSGKLGTFEQFAATLDGYLCKSIGDWRPCRCGGGFVILGCDPLSIGRQGGRGTGPYPQRYRGLSQKKLSGGHRGDDSVGFAFVQIGGRICRRNQRGSG